MTIATEEAERLAQMHEQDAARFAAGMPGREFRQHTAATIRSLAAERDALQAENARLREVLGQTVTLFKEILDALNADPAETKLVLRKEGVEVKTITAADCFESARALLGEKK